LIVENFLIFVRFKEEGDILEKVYVSQYCFSTI